MSQSPLGVGIVGAGAFGQEHARAIADIPDVRLIAASARTPERLAAFTAEFGGVGYADYRELIADPAVDLICIALPHNLHREAAVAAAEAGKPILLEKPMAPTLADCDAIVEIVAQTGVPFMVAHPYRYMSTYQLAKRILEGGEIGEPVICTATMAKDWTFEQRMPWHLEEGGGMWLTNGVHLVDRLSWLIGSLPRDIRASVGTRFHPQQADDVGMGLITFENSVVGVVRAVGYRAGSNDQWTEIQATRGALRAAHTQGVWIARDDSWQQVAPPDQDLPLSCLRPQWRAFLNYVREGGPSPISAEYGRSIVATMVAGRRSSETGQVVSVSCSGG
jgi:predicted dehydrogenase